MKNKKMVFGTMLLLFVLIGICNVINVSADEIEIFPSSYYAKGFDVSSQDTLEIYVSSSGVINVYVMDENQYNLLKDSGSIWGYYVEWDYTTYLDTTYIIRAGGVYYVVLYNEDMSYGRTVDLQITVDYYSNYFLIRIINVFFFVIIPIAIAIIVAVILVKKYKKKSQKDPIIVQEKGIPKVIYCSECGVEILDKTKEFCPQCGAKITK